MEQEFEMSMMEELTFFLGLQIKQAKHGIFIHQAKYCAELLKKFSIDNNKESSTLMAINCYLDVNEGGKCVDQTKYRGIIGSLLYLTASRPDIMHSVCVCVCVCLCTFQSCPKESHLTAIKRLLKYLKGTKCLGLRYPRGANISLVGYNDSYFGGCKVDRKSTSGTCHLLGCSLVSWHSRKQACVTLSTIEA